MTTYSQDQPPADPIRAIDAAKLLKTHPATIHRAIASGRLRGWRLLGRVYVSQAEVQQLWEPIPTRAERHAEAVADGSMPETKSQIAAREAYVDQKLREAGIRK